MKVMVMEMGDGKGRQEYGTENLPGKCAMERMKD